jgi:peptidoglycan-N-acetylglucosamine deacetylase
MKLKALFAIALATLSTAATAFCAESKVMHVTIFIDDGPSANTKTILEILKKENVHANFDLIGQNVEKFPDLAAQIVAEGHAVNDHAYKHLHATQLSDAELLADMKGGYDAILKATGKPPTAYWPPFVEYDPRMDGILKKLNLQMYRFPMIASADDWMMENTAADIRKNILTRVEDGSVLLFHEWRLETAQELPGIIKALKERGCVFLTYEELAAYDKSLKK